MLSKESERISVRRKRSIMAAISPGTKKVFNYTVYFVKCNFFIYSNKSSIMKKQVYFIGSFVFSVFAVAVLSCFTADKSKPVIIAYVGGFRGLVETDSINIWRISHINYAFVDVKDNRAWLHNEATDTINLRKLSELKKQKPDLKILISVGGWSWSKNFSDAVLTDTSTRNFANSAVAIVAKYNLDGVDIDWEYPGMIGDSNMYRPEDREHYTLLFKYLRVFVFENSKKNIF